MEHNPVDPEFLQIYQQFIRKEKEESDQIFSEINSNISLPVKRIRRWWYPAAAALLIILITGTWALTSNPNLFQPKNRYSKAEVRESLEKTIRALSACSKTVREEFSRIEDLTAMSDAISPAKKVPAATILKQDQNNTKN